MGGHARHLLERKDVAGLVRRAVAAVGRRELPVPTVERRLDPERARRIAPHAALHRVEGCVHEVLRHAPGVPGGVIDALEAARRAAFAQHLQSIRLLRSVGGVLDGEGIAWVVMKGPVLASAIYGDPGLRSSIDLDILVGRRQFAPAVRALEGLGFVHLFRNWPWLSGVGAGELPLGAGAMTVDAHWHLVLGDYDRRSFAFEPADLIERARWIEVGGLRVRTFDPVDTVLHVAFHAAHSGADRLVWLKDVERCLAVESIDADELVARARSSRCELPVGLALLRARRTLSAATPDGLPEALLGRSAAAVDRLLTTGFPVERTVDFATPATLAARCAMGTRRASARRLLEVLVDRARRTRAPDRHLDEHDPRRMDSPTRPVGTDEDKDRFLDWVSVG